jgi:hypothetical protein
MPPRAFAGAASRAAMLLAPFVASSVVAGCGLASSPEMRTDRDLVEFVRDARSTPCLVFAGDGVTDSGLAPLRDYAGVSGIWLRGCGHIDGSGFAAFGRMPDLRDFSVWNCPLRSDVAFEWLRETESVRELILAYLDLEDEALGKIAAGRSLEIVRLFEIGGVTDAGIRDLSSANWLREIDVYECPGVSRAAVEYLRDALPDCRIEYEP